MVCYNDQLIVTGGFDNSGTKQNTVFYSNLNMDGSCGSWIPAVNLPVAISNHGTTCYNGLLTVIGGESTIGLSDEVYYSKVPWGDYSLAMFVIWYNKSNF